MGKNSNQSDKNRNFDIP